jgi:CNT family concentrative nucleoside transporter
MEYLRGAFGIIVIVLVAFLFSSNRKRIDWRLVAIGISLQLMFGFLITQVEFVKAAFQFLSEGFVKFLSL